MVEYSQPEEAQKAIRDLTDQTLLGRPIFVREVSTNHHQRLPTAD